MKSEHESGPCRDSRVFEALGRYIDYLSVENGKMKSVFPWCSVSPLKMVRTKKSSYVPLASTRKMWKYI